MGINVRVSDVPTELAARVTAGREKIERELRDQVRTGKVSLDDYLVNNRGYRREHLSKIRERFHASIFGNEKRVGG